jgi:hypothetical protein
MPAGNNSTVAGTSTTKKFVEIEPSVRSFHNHSMRLSYGRFAIHGEI